MMTLEDMLALLPDNTTGAITAADLRTVVTGLYAKASLIGEIESDGTMVDGPDGWSSTMDASGIYTVTHHLGTERYAVMITPMVKDVGGFAPAIAATSTTSFTYGIYSSRQDAPHPMYSAFLVATL